MFILFFAARPSDADMWETRSTVRQPENMMRPIVPPVPFRTKHSEQSRTTDRAFGCGLAPGQTQRTGSVTRNPAFSDHYVEGLDELRVWGFGI